MSQQAFNKLMEYLPKEDREKINAVGMAYGLDFKSPEWIPFAISQHGLLSIQKAIVTVNEAIKQGSAVAVQQATDALEQTKNKEIDVIKSFTEKCTNDIAALTEHRAVALAGFSTDIKKQISETATGIIHQEASKAFSNGTEHFNTSKMKFLKAIAEAENRVHNINSISIWHVVGFSVLSSIVTIGLVIGALQLGALQMVVHADEQQISAGVVERWNQQNAAAAAEKKVRKP
jgi:hypothetical protein